MASAPTWKSVAEEAAFKRLSDILPALVALRLPDAHQALEVLLRRRIENGAWEWGVFEDFINMVELEFSQQDPTYAGGFQILRNILEKTFQVKKRKGKLINLMEVSWAPAQRAHMAATLGVITDETQAQLIPGGRQRTAVLLAGLAHIVRYGTKGDFVRRRIYSWALPWATVDQRRQLVDDFLTVKTKGADGRADTTHIRNAFAHDHFEFLLRQETRIELWDEEDGKETYRATFTWSDLLGLFNMFEKKLIIAEVYPTLLMVIEDLHTVYKKEWRAFRR